MNLAELLDEHERARPDVAAIVEQGRSVSFSELAGNVRRAASLLKCHGLTAGDRVLLFQPMSIPLYEALLALFRIGATAVVLDPGAGGDHIRRCCELAGPAAMIACSRAHLLRITSASIRAIERHFVIGWPVPFAIRWDQARKQPEYREIFAARSETPALLTFTSGSTGEPKGAVRTHGLLLAQHRAISRSLHLVPGAVDLATLPIFALANLASGVTTVIPNADLRRPGAIEPRPLLAQMQRERVTRCVAAPAFLERLLTGCGSQAEALAALRDIYTGGAPVFPRLLAALAAAAPDTRIHAVYGSTEAEPIAEIEYREIRDSDMEAMRSGRGLLTGTPVEEVSLRIIRNHWGTPIGPFSAEAFGEITLPAGEAGEIVVSGDHVLPGYLNGKGDEGTKFRVNGQVWHRTGDGGRLDGEGRLWLLGRCSARIHDDVGELWPFAVECAALQDRAIRRAALIEIRGGRCLAIETGIHEPDPLIASLHEQLRWAHLNQILALPSIPMDRRHNSKVDYPALRKLLQGR